MVLVQAAFVGTETVRSAVGGGLVVGFPVRDGKTVDTQVIANACDDEVGPLAIHNRGKHKIASQIPQLRARRNGAESSASDGEVRVID